MMIIFKFVLSRPKQFHNMAFKQPIWIFNFSLNYPVSPSVELGFDLSEQLLNTNLQYLQL